MYVPEWTRVNYLTQVRDLKAGAMFQRQSGGGTARQDLKLNYRKIIQVLDKSRLSDRLEDETF